MPPRLVRCTCDPAWPAMACCPDCERRELHDLLLRRGQVQDNFVAGAFAALAESYRLDQADETDRLWSERP